jgi:hypothetical protein
MLHSGVINYFVCSITECVSNHNDVEMHILGFSEYVLADSTTVK